MPSPILLVTTPRGLSSKLWRGSSTVFKRAAPRFAPGGLLILSTPNRTAWSRLLTITLAEGFGKIPCGTHNYGAFITAKQMTISRMRGLHLSEDVRLNDLVAAKAATGEGSFQAIAGIARRCRNGRMKRVEETGAHAPPTASLTSAIVAWAAIIFVCPIALLALYALVPNTVELLDRILHHPLMPRRPLALMLLIQVALLTLPAMTFVSWRRGRPKAKPTHRTSRTILLGCATFAVGFLAYLWIALMVAGFPD